MSRPRVGLVLAVLLVAAACGDAASQSVIRPTAQVAAASTTLSGCGDAPSMRADGLRAYLEEVGGALESASSGGTAGTDVSDKARDGLAEFAVALYCFGELETSLLASDLTALAIQPSHQSCSSFRAHINPLLLASQHEIVFMRSSLSQALDDAASAEYVGRCLAELKADGQFLWLDEWLTGRLVAVDGDGLARILEAFGDPLQFGLGDCVLTSLASLPAGGLCDPNLQCGSEDLFGERVNEIGLATDAVGYTFDQIPLGVDDGGPGHETTIAFESGRDVFGLSGMDAVSQILGRFGGASQSSCGPGGGGDSGGAGPLGPNMCLMDITFPQTLADDLARCVDHLVSQTLVSRFGVDTSNRPTDRNCWLSDRSTSRSDDDRWKPGDVFDFEKMTNEDLGTWAENWAAKDEGYQQRLNEATGGAAPDSRPVTWEFGDLSKRREEKGSMTVGLYQPTSTGIKVTIDREYAKELSKKDPNRLVRETVQHEQAHVDLGKTKGNHTESEAKEVQPDYRERELARRAQEAERKRQKAVTSEDSDDDEEDRPGTADPNASTPTPDDDSDPCSAAGRYIAQFISCLEGPLPDEPGPFPVDPHVVYPNPMDDGATAPDCGLDTNASYGSDIDCPEGTYPSVGPIGGQVICLEPLPGAGGRIDYNGPGGAIDCPQGTRAQPPLGCIPIEGGLPGP